MDSVTLATAATTLLAPYLSKIGEKALEKIGEQLQEEVGAVWNGLWNRIKEKPAAADAANDLVTNADDEGNQQIFTTHLKKALEKDEDFAILLEDLLEQARQEVGISNVGDGVVATNGSVGNVFKTGGDISGSTINISSNVGSSSPSNSKK